MHYLNDSGWSKLNLIPGIFASQNYLTHKLQGIGFSWLFFGIMFAKDECVFRVNLDDMERIFIERKHLKLWWDRDTLSMFFIQIDFKHKILDIGFYKLWLRIGKENLDEL